MPAESSDALHFVVLRHEGIPSPHFDLMFELAAGGPLTTWQSPVWPISNRVRVTSIDAHRREYLTYEGPVSDNRGFVRRVASGTFTFSQPDAQTWQFALDGGDAELLLKTWLDGQGRPTWYASVP